MRPLSTFFVFTLALGLLGTGCQRSTPPIIAWAITLPNTDTDAEGQDFCELGDSVEDSAQPRPSAWPNTGRDLQHSARDCQAEFKCRLVPGWAVDVPNHGFGGIVIAEGADGDVILGGAGSEVFAFTADGAPFGEPVDIAAWALEHTPSPDGRGVFGIDTTPVVSADGSARLFTQSGHVVRIRVEEDHLAVQSIERAASGGQFEGGTFFKASPIMDTDGNVYVQTSSATLGGFGGLMKLSAAGAVQWTNNLVGEGSPAINEVGDLVVVSSRVVATVDREMGHTLLQTYNPAPPGNMGWGSLPQEVRDLYSEHPRTQMIQGKTILTGILRGSAVIDPVDGSIYVTKTDSSEGLVSLAPDLRLRWTADPDDLIPSFYHPCDSEENPHYGQDCYPHGLPAWSSTASVAVGIDRVYLSFRVYVGRSEVWFGAFAKSDGRSLWKRRLGLEALDSMRSQPVVDKDGNVAVAVMFKNDDYRNISQLMLFDPDGSLLASHGVDGQTFDGPITSSGGEVLLRANNLYQFRKSCP